MLGTWINAGTVLVGGTVGWLFGRRVPEAWRSTLFHGIGVFTLLLGVRMFFQGENPLHVLLALLIGGVLGEALRIEARLAAFGDWVQRRLPANREDGRIVEAFLTASLLFCVGPMTILGALQDGLQGDYSILATKAVMDGVSALALSAALGPGVLLSILVIVGYQGGLTLFAQWLAPWLSDPMMAAMTATGGVLLAGLAISSLLELRPLRVGNWLPALAVAPLLVRWLPLG